MDTVYAQVIVLVLNGLTLFLSAWLARKVLRPYELLRGLEREVNLQKLDLSDLTDRFSTWQKRDGMRQARAGKETDTKLTEELQRLAAAQPAPPTDTKSVLRAQLAKRRELNG